MRPSRAERFGWWCGHLIVAIIAGAGVLILDGPGWAAYGVAAVVWCCSSGVRR